MITVLKAGPLTTVQDLGRPGFAHLGVPRSGALDQPALRWANELVGNDPSAAGLETTMLGCRLRFESAATIAVAGATCTVKIDGEPVSGPGAATRAEAATGAGAGTGAGAMSGPGPVAVPAGAVVEIGRAVAGVRSYLAVAGGIDMEPVLGSRSTDTLSGLGPPRLEDGHMLPIGRGIAESDRSTMSVPSSRERSGAAGSSGDAGRAGGTGPSAGAANAAQIVLEVWLGPRDDWVEVAGLFGDTYRISPVSNRVACRLAGTTLRRTRAGELPPEGLVLGAVQVPPDGQPLIFLADHPTTGGYPVIGVVHDVTPLAQARPGTSVRFRELH